MANPWPEWLSECTARSQAPPAARAEKRLTRLAPALAGTARPDQDVSSFASEYFFYVQTAVHFYRRTLHARQTPQPLRILYLPDLDDRPGPWRAGDDRGAVGDEWFRPRDVHPRARHGAPRHGGKQCADQ